MNTKTKTFRNTQQKTTPMIDPRRMVALGNLLAGQSVSKAAGNSNVHRDTLRKWMNEEDFSSELQRLLDEQLQSVSHACTALALESMATLGSIQRDEGASEMARIKCCELILQRAGDGQRMASIQKRLEVLQDRMAS
jgi:lipid A disaccharide synthetase